MKKCLIILLILLCAFAAFAEDASLDVTLNVESKGPYYAFNTVKEEAFTANPSSVAGPVSLDSSDLTNLTENQVLYAIATTNSPSAVSAKLSWSDFSASGVETSIPLTISSDTCYINRSDNGLSFTFESAKSTGKKVDENDTASITLTEPKVGEGASNEARAVNFLLKLEADKDAFDKATYVEGGYSTTLTLTVEGA